MQIQDTIGFFVLCMIYLCYRSFKKKNNALLSETSDSNPNESSNKNDSLQSLTLDFDENNYYIFKPKFPFKYAEPMLLTIFKDENGRLNFAIHCVDSNKYKVGEIKNLEVQSSMRNLQELNFDWFYYNYDGFSEQTYVTVYRRSEPSGISTRFIITHEKNQRDSVYDCFQMNKEDLIGDIIDMF